MLEMTNPHRGALAFRLQTQYMVGNPIRRREFGASAMTPTGGRHLRRSSEMTTANSSTVNGVKTLAGKFVERRCRTVEKALHGNSWSLLPSARGNLKWERIQSASVVALWIAIHYQRDSSNNFVC